MADPATQFQTASLQASGYTPVTGGNLGGSHLFGGAGALWAQVGKTALEAGEAIQKSPLNPAVRAQIQYNVDQYKRGQELIAKQRQMGDWGYLLGQTGPQGYSQIAPGQITDPTLAQQYLNRLIPGYPSAGGGGTGPPPAVNTDTGEGGGQPAPQAPPATPPGGPPPGTFLSPATGSYEPLQQPEQPPQKKPEEKKEKKKPPTAKEMGRGTAQVTPATTNMFAAATGAQAPSPTDFQGPTQAQTDVAVREALGRNQFVSSERGVPAGYQPPSGYFLNPATGSYEQLQAQQPQAQQQPQDQDQTPLGKQLMSQWQNQNAHPVAPVSEALKWGKNNFDTRIQDATYLPHGGPLNQPAYAFHMKGGGTNLVPLSQMVRNGFAPNVAGNQTSITLSQADAMQPQADQGQMQPTGAVSGQALALQQGQGAQPAVQMQPTGNVGQPQPPPAAPGAAPGAIAGGLAGAPAAPGGQELRDIYGNPLSAYTGLPSRGGPGPEQLTAQTGPAGTRIEPAPSPTIPNVSKADQDLVQGLADKTAKDAPVDKISGDRRVEGTPAGGPTYYIDDNPDSPSRGRVYTVLPGQKGSYYDQDRWYLGRNEYRTYSLPTSVMRQHMEDYWVKAGQLTPAEIKKMSPEEMKPWLERAWQNNNYTRSPAETGTNLSLDTLEDLHKTTAQIKDILKTVAKHGYPKLNSMDRGNAAIQNAETSIGLRGEWLRFMEPSVAEAVRTLDQKLDHARILIKEHPELLVSLGTAQGLGLPSLPVPMVGNVELPSIPKSDVLSDSAFSGQDVDAKLKALDGYQKAVDTRYKNLVSGAQTQWQKIDDRHAANLIRLDQGKEIPDETNLYSSRELPTVSEAKPTAQPSPTPMVHVNSPSEFEAFKKKYPSGTHFMGPDGSGGVREWVTP
jgi:hypothetical protein